MRAFVEKHPVLSYYLLTFAISWGGVLAIVGPGGFPGTPDEQDRLFMIAVSAMVLGPTLAGLVVTGLVHGRRGLRDLRTRAFRWRVGARWYAWAILLAPLSLLVALVPLSLRFPELAPGILATDDVTSMLAPAIFAALAAGILEEIGWTGFATPELRRRHGVLATGLVVGFLWGAWHYLVNVWGSGTPEGGLSAGLLTNTLLGSVVGLPAYRVLMVWVYARTESLLVAVIMHTSLTASSILLRPLTSDFAPLFAYGLVSAAVTWLVVAIVFMRRAPAPRPLGWRAADQRA